MPRKPWHNSNRNNQEKEKKEKESKRKEREETFNLLSSFNWINIDRSVWMDSGTARTRIMPTAQLKISMTCKHPLNTIVKSHCKFIIADMPLKTIAM